MGVVMAVKQTKIERKKKHENKNTSDQSENLIARIAGSYSYAYLYGSICVVCGFCLHRSP